MIVRFAHICDKCSQCSNEYEAYPSCRECGDDICFYCRNTGKDDPETNSTICKECEAELCKDLLIATC